MKAKTILKGYTKDNIQVVTVDITSWNKKAIEKMKYLILMLGVLMMVGCEKDSGSPADSREEFWAKTFPGSIRAWEFDAKYGTKYHAGNQEMSARDVSEAKWGRGEYAGKTGDCFIDDPFFNPWAPDGNFNK